MKNSTPVFARPSSVGHGHALAVPQTAWTSNFARTRTEMLVNSNEKYQLQGISASIHSFDNHPMPVSRNAHLMPLEPVLT